MKARKRREVVQLGPPCGYQGGKRRFAPSIAAHVLARLSPEGTAFDLCCGSGAVSVELVRRGLDPSRLVMVDAGPWGMFWEAVCSGSFWLEGLRQILGQVPRDPRDVGRFLEDLSLSAPEAPEPFVVLQAGAFACQPVAFRGGRWVVGGEPRYRAKGFFPGPSRGRRPGYPAFPLPPAGDLLAVVAVLCRRLRGAAVVRGKVEEEGTPWLDPSVPGVRYLDPPYEGTKGYGEDCDVAILLSSLPRPFLVSEQREIPGASRVVRLGERKGSALGSGRTARVAELLSAFDVLPSRP